MDLPKAIEKWAAALHGKAHGHAQIPTARKLQNLRNSSLEAGRRAFPSEDAIKLIVVYYRALISIDDYVPFSAKESRGVRVLFQWANCFDPAVHCRSVTIILEKAATLFNIGAHYSMLAATMADQRPHGDKEALKKMCMCFKNAAGAFQELRSVHVYELKEQTEDLTPSPLEAMVNLMVAQAQECIFLTAEMSKMNPDTLAKVAMGCATKFARAAHLAAVSGLTHTKAVVAPYCKVQQRYFERTAELLHCMPLFKQNKMGEVIQRLTHVKKHQADLQAALKAWHTVGGPKTDLLREKVTKQDKAVNALLAKATEDNQTIYFETVNEGLPKPLEARVMAEPAPMDAVLGEDTIADLCLQFQAMAEPPKPPAPKPAKAPKAAKKAAAVAVAVAPPVSRPLPVDGASAPGPASMGMGGAPPMAMATATAVPMHMPTATGAYAAAVPAEMYGEHGAGDQEDGNIGFAESDFVAARGGWAWRGGGQWHNYSPQESTAIEEAYKNYNNSAGASALPIGGGRVVDFTKFRQARADDAARWRAVRRHAL